MTLFTLRGSVLSVPMARGKHLFPYRTQQLSLAAVTILGAHPWENSTVPNYIKAIRIGWLLSFLRSPIIMRKSQTYSLEQIRDSVLTERAAITGVVPGVREQNEQIIHELQAAVQLETPGSILGCQIIGSRAHGSATLKSDLDAVVITPDTERWRVLRLTRHLKGALLPLGVKKVDALVAADLRGVMAGIPSSPVRFAHEIGFNPRCSIGFYEHGVYDTPTLRLGALAASEVIQGMFYDDPQGTWGRVREAHAKTYLGSHDRFCYKVADAMNIKSPDVAKVVTSEVWRERIDRFGLPRQFADQYEAGHAWLAAQADTSQEFAKSVAFYQQVKEVAFR